jgi:PAS domain S-box-containing protein
MKHLTFKYIQDKEYKKAKKEARKSIYKAKLIQLFSAVTDKKKIQKILNQLAKDFPECKVVGTTTAGEISHAKMYDNETIISLSLFKKIKIKIYKTENIDTSSGMKLSAKLCTKNTKALIVLSEGLKGSDYEGFIKGIKKEHPKVIIAGGLAGDNFKLKETFIFIGTKIYTKGALGVSFSGNKLFANNAYNLNWNPIGKEFRVTSVEGNILKEIDNQNAIEIFKKYLGSEIFENSFAALLDFQLLYKEGNTVISRTPMTVENEAIVLAAPIKKGQIFQFGFSNASSIVAGADKISAHLAKNPAEAIYIYSCIARKNLLGKALESEFKPFESIAPTAGFFTYGEFYSTDKNNALLNCTTTVLILSEDKKKSKKSNYAPSNQNNLDNVTFTALTHFIKQTARELKENTQLLEEYKTAVDYTVLVSKTDIHGKITYVNENFTKVSQYSKDELLGQDHNLIRDENMSSFIFKKLWATILVGKVWRGILSNRAKDGTIYYVNTTIMPIFDEKHKIKEFIAIRQNITKQIEAKKRIQEKEKLIKAIFDNQDSIVIYASKTAGMLNVNKKLFDTFEYNSFEEFKRKNSCICDLFIEEEGYIYPKRYPNWLDDIAQNKFGTQVKVKMITRDNTAHTFNLMIKKINDEYIINLYDISDLEKAIFKAHASEHAKSVFLANMSHEIRTPLNGILGFTDVLKKRDLDQDSKRYVDIIYKSGQTLLNVVNDILDFSKIEHGELRLSVIEMNLFQEIEATVASFSSIFKQKQVYYYTYIDSSIPKILLCDAQRIKQVLNNLISNAVKFTPANGDVSVTVQLKSIMNKVAKIHFSIKDGGIGIAKDKIKTVFEAFAQADDSISRKYGGTGLGLAISSQYIQMMHSKIEVESQEGRGSNFFFDLELPIIDENSSIEAENKKVDICVLSSKNELTCAVNEIIFSYLQSWQYSYREIDSLDAIDDNTEVLIVCSKLFDTQACESALNQYNKLELIYIEGINEYFNCSHEKFHFIEQPMTGSALFDKIITLSNATIPVLQKSEDILSPVATYKGNILLAEDNETNQMLISIMLEERKLRFMIVNNGQEVVDAVEKDDFDIIFMDINMPILDGISATKILRENGYTKPIVSLSANVIESDKKIFLEAGVDDTLNKPIILEEFEKVLQKYLGKEIDKKDKDKDIVYDTLSIKKIAQSLHISNEDSIKKLLASFRVTLQESIADIQKNGLNADNLHKLKGVTGNLRLENIYNLSVKFEHEMNQWKKNDYEANKKLILLHCKELLYQLDFSTIET